MQLDKQAPARPALRYYGSKFLLAKWIVGFWPETAVRVIPFAGSLSEEIQAPPARLTVAADLDERVKTFFDQLRTNVSELVKQIKLTPWHESVYEESKTVHPDPLEDARRFFFTCWGSVSGGPDPGSSGFRWVALREDRWTCPSRDAINIDHLYIIAERLKPIQFLNCDGRELVKRYQKIESAFIYCDPPYQSNTRASKTRGYKHDTTEQLHIELAGLLRGCAGAAMICGYAQNKDGSQNDFYRDLYEVYGWRRFDREARTNSNGTRIESVWLNERCYNLWCETTMPLFAMR